MAYDDRALRGVGGWLAFFVITLAVLSPARALLEVVGLMAVTPSPELAGRWNLILGFGVAEMALNSAICFFLAWRLVYVQTPATPPLVIKLLWLKLLVLSPVLLVASAFAAGLPLTTLLVGNAAGVVQALIYTVVWTLYLLNSRRVANTYADEDQVALEAVFE